MNFVQRQSSAETNQDGNKPRMSLCVIVPFKPSDPPGRNVHYVIIANLHLHQICQEEKGHLTVHQILKGESQRLRH